MFTISDFKKSKKIKHNIPRRAIKALRNNMENALFSFGIGDRIGFVMPDIDGDGKPLLIGIQKNVAMDNRPVNAVRSMYGLDNPTQWIKNQIEAGKKFTIHNEKEADSFLRTYGYSASVAEGIKLLDCSIYPQHDFVKQQNSDRMKSGMDSQANQLSQGQQDFFKDSVGGQGTVLCLAKNVVNNSNSIHILNRGRLEFEGLFHGL